MKKLLIIIGVFVAMIAWGQENKNTTAIAQIGRFQIIQAKFFFASNTTVFTPDTILKIDTSTGMTWMLHPSNPKDNEAGVNCIWVSIPDMDAPTLLQMNQNQKNNPPEP